MKGSRSPSRSGVDGGALELGAVVVDLLVGLEDVRADLAAPLDLLLLALHALALGVSLLALDVPQLGLEHARAVAMFLCCERSSWQATTMPVGMWVRRTAESVLLTCWPPAPPERKVSTRRSLSTISTSKSSLSPTSGRTITLAKLVWRRALASKGLMRTRRWTPISERR
jgi:hypothetical protein